MTLRLVPERFFDFTKLYSEAQLALKSMEYKLELLEIKLEKARKRINDFITFINTVSRELKLLTMNDIDVER